MCWSCVPCRQPNQGSLLSQNGEFGQNIVLSQPSARENMYPSNKDRNSSLGHAAAARPYFIPFEFPLLRTKTSYDNHPDGFWDFPERAGWIFDGRREHRKFPNELVEALNPVLEKLDNKYQCRKGSVSESSVKARPNDALSIKCFEQDGIQASLSEEVAFLQAWLFFGVLAELSTITGVPTPYLGAEGQPAILSTAAFDALVRSWVAAIEALSSDGERLKKRGEMLEVVQHIVSLQTCISTVRSQVKEARRLTYDECKVLLAIRVLFRAILLALALSCNPEEKPDLRLVMDPTLAQSFPASWDELKDYATEEMLAAGWCKSECTLLEQFDGVYNFFSSRLTTGRWRMDHSKCHDRLCAADYVDEETYTTVHVQEGCGCDWVRAKPEELCSVLDHGKVPRIVISEDMELVVGDNQPYVAISHVWAHGLGNPHENALPRCQVERLATYISGLQVVREHPGLAIWMDTLCVPVHPDHKSYRKKAIKLMGQTYRNAAAVLVLDRELQRLDMNNVSLLEQDLITAFVGWTRRLWTLQEAALANSLYVQTRWSSHKLNNIVSTEAEDHDLMALICFRQDIAALTRRRIPPMATLKQSVFEEVSPSISGFTITITKTSLQNLAHAVKHRATSKMGDEALILAITLGLDTDTILGAPNVDAGMAAFLTLLKDVPADIIFGTWPKLTHAPFRWAPRSLLGFPLRALQSFGPAATCDSHGLHATYEGFVIEHGTQFITQRDVFVIDKVSNMKYRFQTPDGGTRTSFPETCALIFRPNGVGGDTAVARILGRSGIENKEESDNVIEVVVVGHLIMVGSGGGLEVTGQPVFEGVLTSNAQRWLIT